MKIGPQNEPPYTVDAVVVEDDTFNVLSANPDTDSLIGHSRGFRVGQTTIEEMNASLERHTARPLGSVIVKRGRPLIFQAIVHDLSRDPTCSAATVRRAVENALAEAERRQLTALAFMPLGTRFRTLGEAAFLALFQQALASARFRSVSRIWLVVPDGFGER